MSTTTVSGCIDEVVIKVDRRSNGGAGAIVPTTFGVALPCEDAWKKGAAKGRRAEEKKMMQLPKQRRRRWI
jgi:hypothetical protein